MSFSHDTMHRNLGLMYYGSSRVLVAQFRFNSEVMILKWPNSFSGWPIGLHLTLSRMWLIVHLLKLSGTSFLSFQANLTSLGPIFDIGSCSCISRRCCKVFFYLKSAFFSSQRIFSSYLTTEPKVHFALVIINLF